MSDDDQDDALVGVLVAMVRFTLPTFVPLSFEMALHAEEEDLFRIVLIGIIDGHPHRYVAHGKADDGGKTTLIGHLESGTLKP